jgi:hypothetical protein
MKKYPQIPTNEIIVHKTFETFKATKIILHFFVPSKKNLEIPKRLLKTRIWKRDR